MIMTLSLVACGGSKTEEPNESPAATESETIEKESPMLQSLVAAGELPELSERLPVESDIMVETDKTPENPQYGGTLRRNNGGEWDYGPFCEEPLFRLTEDGGVTPKCGKGL